MIGRISLNTLWCRRHVPEWNMWHGICNYTHTHTRIYLCIYTCIYTQTYILLYVCVCTYPISVYTETGNLDMWKWSCWLFSECTKRKVRKDILFLTCFLNYIDLPIFILKIWRYLEKLEMSGVRYVYVCAHIGLCLVSVNVKVKRQLLSVILLFCHVGTKNGTHIRRFCGRFLYPVSHLTGSVQFSFHCTCDCAGRNRVRCWNGWNIWVWFEVKPSKYWGCLSIVTALPLLVTTSLEQDHPRFINHFFFWLWHIFMLIFKAKFNYIVEYCWKYIIKCSFHINFKYTFVFNCVLKHQFFPNSQFISSSY